MTVIALLPGDGIGSEILDGPIAYLRKLQAQGAPVTITGPWPYGSTGWKESGDVLPQETIDACHQADVILSGAVGTHPGIDPKDCPNPESGLIKLRHIFDLRVSVRNVLLAPHKDVIVVRNIIGGAYGDPQSRQESDGVIAAIDTVKLEPEKVREVLNIAADYSLDGYRTMSVDKASVYATSRMWRRLAAEVFEKRGVKYDNVNVDRAAYELVKYEELPRVVATEGLFGDILSDVLCARAGSPALCGSATINPDRIFGHGVTALFEPAHGSSPHRTGSRRSNPTGAWLALIELLNWCPDLAALDVATKAREALLDTIAEGPATYDLAKPGEPTCNMVEFNERVLAKL